MYLFPLPSIYLKTYQHVMHRYEIHYMYQDEGPRHRENIPTTDDLEVARGRAFALASTGSDVLAPMGWVFDTAACRYVGNYPAAAKDYEKDWMLIASPHARIKTNSQAMHVKPTIAEAVSERAAENRERLAHEPSFAQKATHVSIEDRTKAGSDCYREYQLDCQVGCIQVKISIDDMLPLSEANAFCKSVSQDFFAALNSIMQAQV